MSTLFAVGSRKSPLIGKLTKKPGSYAGQFVHFESVDVIRVRNGKITDHWGVENLFSLMQQLDALPVTMVG